MRWNRTLPLLLLAAFVSWTPCAFAQIDPAWVSPCGTDADTTEGTIDDPYQTIAGALLYSSASEIVVLPNDNMSPYPETTISMANNGVTIRAASGPSETQCVSFLVQENVSCTIIGFHVTNSGTTINNGVGVLLEGDTLGSTQVNLFNMVISDCNNSGITALRDPDALNNDNQYYSLTNCTIVGNGVYGIDTFGDGDQLTPGSIANCVIGSNAIAGIRLDGSLAGGGLQRVYLRYTAFYQNGPAGADHWVGSSGFFIRSNNYDMNLDGWFGSAVAGVPCFDPSYQLLCPDVYNLNALGNPAPVHLNPDLTRNDLGAYGGAQSLGFYSCPAMGPEIIHIVVRPCDPMDPDRVTINVVVKEN